MVSVWLIVLALNTFRESATPDHKENKQADAGSRRFRRHFLCGALLCNFSSTEHEGLSTYLQRECSAEPFLRSILSRRIFASRPGSRLRYFIEMQIQYPTSTLLYSSIIRLYPQNPVFEIVHDESVKVYLHMYNGNVQQNPLCVESCVTKEFSMSPRFSSTIFYPEANSVLLRAHLCTAAVDPMRRKPCCVRNCSRKREGLYNGNAQQNPLCAVSCVTKDIHISPRFSPTIFYRDTNSVLLLAHLCTAILLGSMCRILLCWKLFMMRARRSIYTCTTGMFSRTLYA